MNEQPHNQQGPETQAGGTPNPGPPGYNPPSGVPYAPPVANPLRKSAVLATLLSMFPGLGQVYVGYYQVGFAFGLTMITTIAMLASQFGRGKEPFLGVFLAFFWIFNMIDANRRAQHYNRSVEGLKGEEIPEGFKTAGGLGSVPVGVILVVVGGLFILDLNFGVSLSWIEDWWPLAIVAFGIYLIRKGRQN
jgi:hypothetical protein